ncbi:MAG: hypothetical protein Q7K57_11560 [Burkholderiaceae bacterium]|nr:hypothetical protein [Burkholderiaceae bacterium]
MQFSQLAQQISVELADDNVSSDEITNCLRSFCLRNADQPRAAIEVASALHSYFLAVQEALPNLHVASKSLLFAKRLSQLPLNTPDPALRYGEFLFLQRANHAQNVHFLPIFDFSDPTSSPLDTPQIASCLVVIWLARSLSNYIPSNPLTPQSIQPKEYLPIHLILSELSSWSKNPNNPQILKNEITDLGFSKWLTFITEQMALNQGSEHQKPYLDCVLEAAQYLIKVDADIARSEEGRTPQEGKKISPLTYPRDFTLRNLLKSHWFSATPFEIKSLKDILTNLDEPAFDLNAPIKRNPPIKPDLYETIILGLALATGHSVAEVLNFSVNCQAERTGNRFATDFFQVESVKVGSGGKREPWVFRNIQNTGPNDLISLPLPASLSRAIIKTLYITSVTRFEHLLPLSHIPWVDRCNLIIERELSIKSESESERTRLMVRDFLARQLFHSTTNEAIVRLLCDQSTNQEGNKLRQQVSLSHYIDIQYSSVWDIYKKACSPLFTFKNLPDSIEKRKDANFNPAKHALTPEQFTSVSETMRERIANTYEQNDLIKSHNAMAEYTLFMLVASTGHRKSKTPFYYPWDICLEERLAFISDKQLIGAEARIVPLPQVVINQYCAYIDHLNALLHKLSDPEFSDVKNHVQTLLSSFRPINTRSTVVLSLIDPQYSQFFRIARNNQPQTISTSRFHEIIRDESTLLSPPSISTLGFRNALSDYLWKRLESGTEVQAWLGHATELHSFGEASTWSMVNLANKIRPHIETYLKERGMIFATSRLTKNKNPTVYENSGRPSIKMGHASYEGRALSKKFASIRAQKVLLKLLPEELIEWQQNSNPSGEERIKKALEIDTALYDRIEKEFILQLGGDRPALTKVKQTLAEKIKEFSSQGVKVTTPKVNLFRADPGPLSINFSRHLRIANEMRRRWVSNELGQGLGRGADADPHPIKRLAQIAISLVVFDATLDPMRVKALTLAATSKDGLQIHPNTLTLRAPIRTSRDVYDWLILPSPITTALIFGILNARKKITRISDDSSKEAEDTEQTENSVLKTENTLWKSITKEIGEILNRMQPQSKTGTARTLDELCQIFRPWWHLRLPGSTYAVSIGDYVGPAPSRSSEESLFAAQEPTPFVKQATPALSRVSIATSRKSINDCINEIFSRSDVAISRTSRQNLRRELNRPYEPVLLHFIDEQPIIRHALGFINYLLDVGGPSQSILKFSSIRTYYSNVMPTLIDEWWDHDFTEWTGDQFDQAYADIFKLNHEKMTPANEVNTSTLIALRQFHRYLRDSADVAFSSFLFRQNPQPSQRRSDILTQSAIEHAIDDIHNDVTIPDLARAQSESLIAFAAGYGLRNSEAIAIKANSFLSNTDPNHGLRINGNNIADIKTAASRRVIARPLMSKLLEKIAFKTFTRAQISKKRGVATSANPALITIKEADMAWDKARLSQRCIASLRRAAASNATVLHTLRHTFATAVMLELFGPKTDPSAIVDPSTKHIDQGLTFQACTTARRRLLGTMHLNSDITDMLQMPANWPFGVDSAAQVIGHSDVSTLLNYYFHGACILLAEQTHGYSKNESLQDSRMALILGIDRSAIIYRRKNTKTPLQTHNKDFSSSSPIEQLLCIDFKKLLVRSKPVKIRKQKTPPLKPDAIPWATLDDLLMDRAEYKYSLESMKNRTQSICDDSEISERFVKVYTGIVEDSGFDDFEFKNSELTERMPKHSKGVSRSRQERRKCLHMLEDTCFKKPSLLAELKLLTKIWVDRIDPKNEWLVLKNASEGRAFVSFCKALNISISPKIGPDLLAALEEISTLMGQDPDEGTPDGDHLNALVTLVQVYEAKNYAIAPPD